MDGQLSFATLDYAGKKKRTKREVFLAEMAATYCLQQWYNLSDPGAEEALYDIQSTRAFCDLELGRDPRTGLRCSRCWRSQTCISPAGSLRPPDDPGHPLPPAAVSYRLLTRKMFA